ncbi:dihydroneopterin aldolase [Microbacterium sp. HD4P20]|uniref:dihydroneopterin aldolase n=1 Tax=Microbacterium sp. HD4P20 TaxID=2864874 RepID=UPI001C6446E1|nr:dihydroneopterin aldolase [Microbacterium sp. HD4P20]MCP2635359.1 dihydroneopterin aldolase [Microbacterium sp. HD4P20]
MDFADEIVLTGIRAFGYHGVFEAERRDGQEFVVDTTLYVKTARAAASDDVADTVHYGEVAERIVEIVSGEPVNLIETLAVRIAEDLLTRAHVQMVAVTVHKPSAPITVPFADVAVTVRRTQHPIPDDEGRA